MNPLRVLLLSGIAAAVLLGGLLTANSALRMSGGTRPQPSPPPTAAVTPPAPMPAVQPPSPAMLPVLADRMPPFEGIVEWLNGATESPESLRGRVTLVHFWTFGCINCIHTMPYVTAWYDRYATQGFTVVGVHTPEFAYEGEKKAILEAIARHGVHYPVAMDNAFKTWNLYDNRYWPAFYLFDAQGRLRYQAVGEGGYEQMEANIQALLQEKTRP